MYFKGVSSMCRLMEQMRNEAAEKSAVEQVIKDARNLMDHFRVGAEEAITALKIPAEYLETVLTALNAK